jgi:cell wall-associated NlpC family hydrolase
MARVARAFPIALSLAFFAFAPAASAHRWHDPDGWGDQQQQEQPQDQPQQQGGPWDQGQGDPAETPQDWTQAPVQAPADPWVRPGDHGGGQWHAPELPLTNKTAVPGRSAMLRKNGKAAIPRSAPKRVQAIISAANRIIGKPYKWGGGHGRLADSGYDCSGSVSYALIRGGQLGYPMVSGSFARWGLRGAGRYVTIYANRGHVYMEVAGLRLDTSAVGDARGKHGVRWRPVIGRRVGFAVRHVPGL